MKRVLIILIFVFLAGCGKFEGGTSKNLQDDFDKFRINDLKYLYSLAREYKDKTGYFPFEQESKDVPIVVVFESAKQAAYHKGKYSIMVDLESRGQSVAPKKIEIKTFNEFYAKVENALLRKVIRKFDPQKVSVKKPCVYIYVVYKNTIDISVFLHNALAFTRNLSPFNNKLAITSYSDSYPDVGLWNLNELENLADYKNFIAIPLNKPGYDKILEQEHNQGMPELKGKSI
ncbi:MAG: hypothetical protein KKD05_05425 [Candidatus Omnitrophica bacterium]|nr:hypothetical protein [Candidatus Omnitrophota bacterium]